MRRSSKRKVTAAFSAIGIFVIVGLAWRMVCRKRTASRVLKCVFCDCELLKPSEEHVFLSAIGGRVVSNKLTCGKCNNAFSTTEVGKIDETFADSLIIFRNALRIWSGRKGPPPIIHNAGTMDEGIKYDLLPGLIPATISNISSQMNAVAAGNGLVNLVAKNEEDARRLLEVLKLRGTKFRMEGAIHVTKKVPLTKLSTTLGGSEGLRSAAKT